MCAYYKRRYPGGGEMAKDLTVSGVERQNILNNPYALEEIRSNVGIHTISFKGAAILTKEQVADFFEVSTRTIDYYLAQNEAELKQNGYEVLRGNALQELKKAISDVDVDEMYFVNIKTDPPVFLFQQVSLL
jgi:hypothetical protein